MKKSHLRQLIREAIKEQTSGPYVVQPFFDLRNQVVQQTGLAPPQPFIQRMISKFTTEGKGCQFVCNRLQHFVDKYNAKGAVSPAGYHQGGFGNTHQGQVLASKITYFASLGANFHHTMCLVNGGTPQSCQGTGGSCGCPTPQMN